MLQGCGTVSIDKVPMSLIVLKWYRSKPRSLLNRNMIVCIPASFTLSLQIFPDSYAWKVSFVFNHILGTVHSIDYRPQSRDIICLVASVCPSVRVCETYVVHHLVSRGVRCAPPTCIVHHHPAYQLGGAQDDFACLLSFSFLFLMVYNAVLSVSVFVWVLWKLLVPCAPLCWYRATLCTIDLHCLFVRFSVLSCLNCLSVISGVTSIPGVGCQSAF